MKCLLLLVIWAGATFSPALSQSPGTTLSTNSRVERVLLRLTEEISLASERKDEAALDRLIADGFILTLANGKTYSKAQMIERWAGSDPNVTEQSHTISNPQVLVYGDTAVVIAIITDAWRDEQGQQTYQERIFDVWQKQQGGWRLIASKPTKVEPL